ncbi:hypothetical protein SAMN05216417_1354 [Nitrosospira multiformis]|uniref:Uncharacterized protein n=2 Tax=Nitrosospira multiformis TaxID=1231 RepID=A0A1I7IZQ7_9PROT|nr:hypothetical protein SAMN05216417_1354 [Nitrosospira multiformis]
MMAPETAFEVLDALGLVQLVKRSGDLGGAVPLRVAQDGLQSSKAQAERAVRALLELEYPLSFSL